MRIVSIILGFIALGVVAHAGTGVAGTGVFDFDPADGTYKTVAVTSPQQCSALCRADDLCRGAVTYQPDTRYKKMECRLNDGMSPASPFEVKPPPPLDMITALNDLNIYRARYGLSPVALDQRLIDASARHAQDLAIHGRAAHDGSDGSSHADRASDEGYNYRLISENVATGQESWEIVFKAWQNSPGHNENLLQPDVSDFGVALVYEPTTKYITYWAMLVGKPL